MIKTKIDAFHLKDIKNHLHPSSFTSQEEYDILIFRLPIKIENKLEVENSAFIFTKNGYFFYDKLTDKFMDLKNIKEIYNFLNKKVDEVMELTLKLFTNIENIEDKFYENIEIKNFNKKWFSYKNQLIRISRILLKTIEEFKKFIQNYKKEDNFLEINFYDLLEHLERAHRNSSHSLEKLDAIYNFHSINSNEKMNKTIYILTLLSGIFLPLNLIVGFFGMNTTDLPLTKIENGTFFVISLLILVGVITTLLVISLKKKNQ